MDLIVFPCVGKGSPKTLRKKKILLEFHPLHQFFIKRICSLNIEGPRSLTALLCQHGRLIMVRRIEVKEFRSKQFKREF